MQDTVQFLHTSLHQFKVFQLLEPSKWRKHSLKDTSNLLIILQLLHISCILYTEVIIFSWTVLSLSSLLDVFWLGYSSQQKVWVTCLFSRNCYFFCSVIHYSFPISSQTVIFSTIKLLCNPSKLILLITLLYMRFKHW